MEKYSIIKSLSNYIHLHSSFLFFALIAILIGSFFPFLIITTLIIVHELGHYLTAKILKVPVEKIHIYPFGGHSKLNNNLNDPISKELLILIMGPITQILFFVFLIRGNYLSNDHELIRVYHYYLLIFNLLPIYPLDGGKLINLLTSIIYPFKKSLFYTIYLSYLITILLFSYLIVQAFTLNILLLFILVIIKIVEEDKKKNYIIKRFLLERYTKKFNFKKIKEVKHIDEFMRNKRHIILNNGHYYTEREVLRTKFEKKT